MNRPESEDAIPPDGPAPDRLMSSVMSLAREAVSRVEEYRAAVDVLIRIHDDGLERTSEFWRAFEALRAVHNAKPPE